MPNQTYYINSASKGQPYWLATSDLLPQSALQKMEEPQQLFRPSWDPSVWRTDRMLGWTSASISTTSETLMISVETNRGKLQSQTDCWLPDIKRGAIAVSPCYRQKMCRSCKETVTAIAAHLQTCFPAGNLVQRSIERASLYKVPLDVVCDVVEFFEHVKELQCQNPQQVCLFNGLLLTHTQFTLHHLNAIVPWREEHHCSCIYQQ